MLMILISVLVFIGVIPVIIKAPFWISYIVFFVLGLCLGWFFDHMLRHIEMTYKH